MTDQPQQDELIRLLREMDSVQQETDEEGGTEVAWYYYRDEIETALGLPPGSLNTEGESAP